MDHTGLQLTRRARSRSPSPGPLMGSAVGLSESAQLRRGWTAACLLANTMVQCAPENGLRKLPRAGA